MNTNIGLLLACALVLAAARLDADETDKPTTISIGSVSIFPTKWDKDANSERIERMVRDAADQGARDAGLEPRQHRPDAEVAPAVPGPLGRIGHDRTTADGNHRAVIGAGIGHQGHAACLEGRVQSLGRGLCQGRTRQGDDDRNARSCLARMPRRNLRNSGGVIGTAFAP